MPQNRVINTIAHVTLNTITMYLLALSSSNSFKGLLVNSPSEVNLLSDLIIIYPHTTQSSFYVEHVR